MTSRDFCYWLQGYFELKADTRNADRDELSSKVSPLTLTVEQVQVIRNHLNMVFKHEIDPSHGPKPHQDALSALHQGLSSFDSIDTTPKFNC